MSVLAAKSAAPADLVQRVRTACMAKRIDLSALPPMEKLSAFTLSESDRTLKMRQVLDSNLAAREPAPIGVRYCADVLYKRTATGVNPISGKISRKLCNTGWHASAVIGRRPGASSCQYLIKNTWGASCKGIGYDKSHDCENGKLWIDGDDLLRNTTGVFWFTHN